MSAYKKDNKAKGKRKTITKSKRAELNFPIGRIHRFLRKGKYAKRIGDSAPVYLGAVLEYLTSEVLELAVRMALDENDSKITPYHINIATLLDPELEKLLKGVTIPEGGVLPSFHFVDPKKLTVQYTSPCVMIYS